MIYEKMILNLAILMIYSATLYGQKIILPLEFQANIGLENIQAPNLNTMLKSNNLKLYPKVGMNISAQVGYNFKYITAGGGYAYVSIFDKDKWENNNIFLYISTNSIQNDIYIISPQIGFGGSFTTYNIVKKKQSGDFEDFLTTNSNITKLEHTNDFIDVSVTLKKKKNNLYSPQFRIGYKFGLQKNDWKVSNVNVVNPPKDRITSIYLQLAFGMAKMK